jgi:hypothetical protein
MFLNDDNAAGDAGCHPPFHGRVIRPMIPPTILAGFAT